MVLTYSLVWKGFHEIRKYIAISTLWSQTGLGNKTSMFLYGSGWHIYFYGEGLINDLWTKC